MSVLDRAARFIIDRRLPAQAIIGILAIFGLFAMSELRFELTPASLVADAVPRGEDARALDAAFGVDAEQLLVVITAPDVLSAEALSHQHRIARWLTTQPWTSRVESITTTALPHRVPERQDITLDDLENDAQLLALPLPVGELADALSAVAETDASRFPEGMRSIVAGWADRPLAFGPLVSGEDVDEEAVTRIREVASARGLFVSSLIAADGRVALIAATVSGESDGATEHAARSLEAHLAEIEERPAHVETRAGGLPHVRARLVDALASDLGLLIALACLGSIAMLAIGFRSVSGVVLPMAAVGMTLAIVVGGMAMLDVPIDLLTNLVPPLLITIGLGDGVHLLTRFREERRAGEAAIHAARRTLSAMSVACFMTSITTAVGFGTLVISETPILRRFGLVAAGAVMLTYVVTVVFLPTALATFAGPVARTRTATKSRLLDAFVGRLSTWSTTRPAWIVAFAVGLMILCVPAAWGVRVDGALLDQFESSSDVIQTTRAVERHLGGIRTLSVGARARRGSMLDPERLETLDVIAEGLRREEGVLRVTTPGDVLRETWSSVIAVDDETATDALTARPRIDALAALGRAGEAGRAPALDRFATRDGRLARIEVRLADLGVRHINGVIDRLESRLSHTETLDTFIAGEAYRASRGLDRVMTDLAWSLALAVLVILASIGVLFRSPRLALVSVLPNLLPLAAVAGWMGLRNIPLHAATVIVFGVSIGLAVDGTIHVISRYREELSIERAMAGSGRAIILSSGALILGFLALQVSGFVPIRRFGELSIVAILAAVVADLTLLPALLSLSSRVRA